MFVSRKIAALAATAALVALSASVGAAQTPDTRIVVIGAINNPAHVQTVTDGRDNAVPEMPVVYDNRAQTASPQAQPTSARTHDPDQTLQPASASRTDLNQTVKAQ